MPFQSQPSADVASILSAGGLAYAQRLIMSGIDAGRVRELIGQRYTPIGGSPYPRQVYEAVLRRAESALSSGASMQRKRNDAPFEHERHTGAVGLPSAYRYDVVVEFRDALSGHTFTTPFYVDSDVALSKWDALAYARGQAFMRLNQDGDTLGAGSGMELELTGRERIAAALSRI